MYEPPKQSRAGQLIDAVFILALVFVVLFGVTYFLQSSSSTSSTKTRPVSQLPITKAEKAQYQKVIHDGLADLPAVNQQVADNKASSNKYPIGLVALIATFGVIALYLIFVYVMSFREYREVIYERFGPPTPDHPEPEV
ncbi:MAG: hypothetical protein ACRDQ1_03795 [Sciscionella sp.]